MDCINHIVPMQAILGGLGASPKEAALQTVHLMVLETYELQVTALVAAGPTVKWWPGYGAPHAGTVDFHMLNTVMVVSVLQF